MHHLWYLTLPITIVQRIHTIKWSVYLMFPLNGFVSSPSLLWTLFCVKRPVVPGLVWYTRYCIVGPRIEINVVNQSDMCCDVMFIIVLLTICSIFQQISIFKGSTATKTSTSFLVLSRWFFQGQTQMPFSPAGWAHGRGLSNGERLYPAAFWLWRSNVHRCSLFWFVVFLGEVLMICFSPSHCQCCLWFCGSGFVWHGFRAKLLCCVCCVWAVWCWCCKSCLRFVCCVASGCWCWTLCFFPVHSIVLFCKGIWK